LLGKDAPPGKLLKFTELRASRCARRCSALAYVEEDGLLLSVGFLAAIILIGLGSAAVWGTIIGAVLIGA
jgi:hypothetical protein